MAADASKRAMRASFGQHARRFRVWTRSWMPVGLVFRAFGAPQRAYDMPLIAFRPVIDARD